MKEPQIEPRSFFQEAKNNLAKLKEANRVKQIFFFSFKEGRKCSFQIKYVYFRKTENVPAGSSY